MKNIFTHPLFILGLALRLGLLLLAEPVAVEQWYAPFLSTSLEHFSLDPWGQWLTHSPSTVAFPYGYAMWMVFLPLSWLSFWMDLPIHWAYSLTLVLADLALLLLLDRLTPGRSRLLLGIYWLSPITLLATYGLGLNDLIPILVLMLSVYLMRLQKPSYAGFVLGCAVSAKLSMVLALPFFLVYQFHNRPLRQYLPQFLTGATLSALLLIVPLALSPAAMVMIFQNPEMGKVYEFALQISGGTKIYLLPMAYCLLLYGYWRVKRMNFHLFVTVLGITFLLVVIMTPASPGWFVWLLPMLVAYQTSSDRLAIALCSVFALLYVAVTLTTTSMAAILGHLHPLFMGTTNGILGQHAQSLIYTGLVASGCVLAIRIWREAVVKNDYFRLSRKPFVMGIAGDSGAGKDTLAKAVENVFGMHSTAHLSGDNYHRWDRQKPMWQVMTHLNPMANNLEAYCADLVKLIDGKSISSRHYNHQSGKMSQPGRVDSNDFIIASGLHALYLPLLRRCYDLSIYLDIDESLRRHFKTLRDVTERGHPLSKVLASFEKRESDSNRFIRPQASMADLTMSLQPLHRLDPGQAISQPIRLKLVVGSRIGIDELSLTRVLVGICGLHVDMQTDPQSAHVHISIEGDPSAHDIELAVKILCPRLIDFFDIRPIWQDGVTGLMQLMTLIHIDQALTKRFI